MSCDLETGKTVVPRNSSSKPDQTGSNRKGVKQSEMFNYSIYSRLGNFIICLYINCQELPSNKKASSLLHKTIYFYVKRTYKHAFPCKSLENVRVTILLDTI